MFKFNDADCPAGRLAILASTFIHGRAEFESLYPEEFEALTACIAAVEEVVTTVPASSRLGVFYQLLVARGRVDDALSWVEGQPEAVWAGNAAMRILDGLVHELAVADAPALAGYYMTTAERQRRLAA